MTKNDRLREMYKHYGLTSEDYFKHQHYTILTRGGIEKVQAKEGLEVKYYEKVLEKDFAVIKAVVERDGKTIETFGSALKGDYKSGNCNTWYIAEMAEKRALSRVVLKATGFYSLGVFGEDESDDFKKGKGKDMYDKQDITTSAISKAKNMIIRGEKTADEMIAILEENYQVGESLKFSFRQLKTKEELQSNNN